MQTVAESSFCDQSELRGVPVAIHRWRFDWAKCGERLEVRTNKAFDEMIECFRELIANGSTVVLADNSPELLIAADCVIELE